MNTKTQCKLLLVEYCISYSHNVRDTILCLFNLSLSHEPKILIINHFDSNKQDTDQEDDICKNFDFY